MLSIYSLFEAPNVPNGNANGLTVPFGYYNPSKDNNKTLSDFQDLNELSPDKQVKRIRKNNYNLDAINF